MKEAKYEYFVYCPNNNSVLLIEKNLINYDILQAFIKIYQLESFKIFIDSIKMNLFSGVLLLIEKESQRLPVLSNIFIRNSDLILNNSADHFILLKADTNLTILNCNFFISNDQQKSFVFISRQTLPKLFSELNISRSTFETLISSKNIIRANSNNTYSFVHIERGFKNVILVDSKIFIGEKNFKALLLTINVPKLMILVVTFLENKLNRRSHFLWLFFDNVFQITVNKSIFLNNKVVYGGIITIEAPSNFKESTELSVLFTNCTILNNMAANRGGFLYVNTSSISEKKSIDAFISRITGVIDFDNNIIKRIYAPQSVLVYWEG